jgi:hypothetical protein
MLLPPNSRITKKYLTTRRWKPSAKHQNGHRRQAICCLRTAITPRALPDF